MMSSAVLIGLRYENLSQNMTNSDFEKMTELWQRA